MGFKHDRTDPGLLKGYAEILPGYTMDDIIGTNRFDSERRRECVWDWERVWDCVTVFMDMRLYDIFGTFLNSLQVKNWEGVRVRVCLVHVMV